MIEDLNENEEVNLDAVISTSRSTSVLENSDTETKSEVLEKMLEEKPAQTNAEKKPFLEPLKTNRFFLVRILYYVLRSIWIVAMIVGSLIAWIISLLFI